MKVENQSLIRFKTTKSLVMDYITDTGSILITIIGNKKDLVTPHYVIEVQKRQVYPLLRGLIGYTQRFYKKHGKKNK